jgi:hypothetical protein
VNPPCHQATSKTKKPTKSRIILVMAIVEIVFSNLPGKSIHRKNANSGSRVKVKSK